MNFAIGNKFIRSVTRQYFYACVSLFVGFILPILFEPLREVGRAILNVLLAVELAPLLKSLAYGFVIAALSTFTWNFFAGAGLQILTVIFGVETPQIVLFGRAAIIGFIYGATRARKLENGTRKQRLVNSLVGPLPFTYNKVKHELKREIRSAARLCPTIAAILLFSAMLEIWLILS